MFNRKELKEYIDYRGTTGTQPDTGQEQWKEYAQVSSLQNKTVQDYIDNVVIEKYSEDFISLAQEKRLITVLDIGCGDGKTTWYVLEQLVEKFKYKNIQCHMLDPSEQQLANAKKICQDGKINGCAVNFEFHHQSCEDFFKTGAGRKGGGYDIIFSFYAFQWIKSEMQEAILQQVLESQDSLFINYYPCEQKPLDKIREKLLGEDGDFEIKGWKDPFTFTHDNLAEWQESFLIKEYPIAKDFTEKKFTDFILCVMPECKDPYKNKSSLQWKTLEVNDREEYASEVAKLYAKLEEPTSKVKFKIKARAIVLTPTLRKELKAQKELQVGVPQSPTEYTLGELSFNL